MAHEKFFSSKVSTLEQIQGENHNYCFFDSRDIVRKEFVSLGQTVNHVFYKDDWLLQHDNAPPHNALSIREFLAEKSIPVLPHPPYSPDLASSVQFIPLP